MKPKARRRLPRKTTGRRAASCLLAAVVLLCALRAEAQRVRDPYRIGAITGAWAPNHPAVEGLKAGLKEMGIREGDDVLFDIRFTRGNFQAMPMAAAALIKVGANLIFTTNEASTKAAMAATQKIPIVFTGVGDPVAAGIVASFARPQGNVSGVSALFTELAPKRLEILKTIAPGLRRVLVIYEADDPQSIAAARKAQEAAPILRVGLLALPVRTPEELARGLKSLQPGDGLMAPDVAALDIPDQTLQASLSARVPIIFGPAFWAGHGALVSYGADYHAQGRQAARLVAKILRGARPQDLPVEGANKIELIINLKTAKKIGLEIPPEMLMQADRVIR